jgi:hypothetical protein
MAARDLRIVRRVGEGASETLEVKPEGRCLVLDHALVADLDP